MGRPSPAPEPREGRRISPRPGDGAGPARRGAGGSALLAEPALAEDWDRPEEDAAWPHLQPAEEADRCEQ
jgi:hypothetical protein